MSFGICRKKKVSKSVRYETLFHVFLPLSVISNHFMVAQFY